MFKNNSFEDEIKNSLEKNLIEAQKENQYNFNKLARAIDYLHSAATIFDNAGMQAEANEIIEILSGLANNLDKVSSNEGK